MTSGEQKPPTALSWHDITATLKPFSMVKKYGLPMLVTADEGLKEYLQTILAQVQGERCFGRPSLVSCMLTDSSRYPWPIHIPNSLITQRIVMPCFPHCPPPRTR
jgi:hypothetical protein